MNLSDVQIAVVDDDESLCRSMSRLLRASELHSRTFASAEAFLADERHEGFDCIVLDVQLEGMSGLELCRHLSGKHGTAPVIIITALDDPDVKQQAARAGCFQCFSKTDPGHEVVTAILQAVTKHRQEGQ
jgi:FixJ family two-component response regulator